MTNENLVHSLIERTSTFEIRNDRPHLAARFRGMVEAFELSYKNDDRLRDGLRKMLPLDLSPTLVPEAEHLVNETGEALRKNLYALFVGEINAALRRDLEPSTINR